MSAATRRTFSAQSTTDEVLAGIDLSGRVAIVTGASGGLGEETARALASRGCAVTIAARDESKAEKAALRIRERCPQARVDVGRLELSEPTSVEAFAQRWLKEHDALHLLILNAGIMASPLARTAEGWEMQFATNHLGHFLLSARLIERLRASAPARVIVLSSGGHVISPVVFADIHYERRDYDPWTSYGQSKTANVLFASELDRRERARGVRAHAVHPGVIHTDLGRHLTPEVIRQIVEQATSAGAETYKSVEQGAATSVWAATAPELEGQGGLYLADCGIPAAPEAGGKGAVAHARDADAAARLWAVSEKTLGISFA
jgi:NAD(P)-dependent dehydrogenase (short-subunit alcohol dehydrogenase family)